MKIGLQVPTFSWPGQPGNIGSKLIDIARAADHAGFASLWVMDHYFQLEPGLGKADEPMLEGYSTLSFLAAVTQHIRLGTLVTGVIYRQPGFLVKAATTLDVLSGGRAYFGVGAAWYEREAVGLGFPFPPISERFERLEEILQIAHQMWSGDRTPYQGKHYQLAEPVASPPPLSKPHPPILIGGSGERKTLRLVAQYADACNLFARNGTQEVAHKLDVLKRHCETLGRDYDEIERTSLGTVHLAPGAMSVSDVIRTCRELADVGIQHAIFNMPANVHEITPLDTFAREIIPAVAGF
jgi:F420-dependent oxidoreductase-like protein